VKYHVAIDGEDIEVEILEREGRQFAVVGGREREVDFRTINGGSAGTLLLDTLSRQVSFESRPDGLSVTMMSEAYVAKVEDERTRAAREVSGAKGLTDHSKVVLSMMPGIVREVMVAPGDEVEAGQSLLILEAMKMENEIRAALPGVVKTVHAETNQTVNKGDALVTLE
jgi:biotin carboxyl carrier protein